jgi:hypothetical protein
MPVRAWLLTQLTHHLPRCLLAFTIVSRSDLLGFSTRRYLNHDKGCALDSVTTVFSSAERQTSRETITLSVVTVTSG